MFHFLWFLTAFYFGIPFKDIAYCFVSIVQLLNGRVPGGRWFSFWLVSEACCICLHS